MSTHSIHFHVYIRNKSPKYPKLIIFLTYRMNFLRTQKRVQINHGKRAIGVRVNEVLLYLENVMCRCTCFVPFQFPYMYHPGIDVSLFAALLFNYRLPTRSRPAEILCPWTNISTYYYTHIIKGMHLLRLKNLYGAFFVVYCLHNEIFRKPDFFWYMFFRRHLFYYFINLLLQLSFSAE